MAYDLFVNASSESHLLTNTNAWLVPAGRVSDVDTVAVDGLVGAEYTLTGSDGPETYQTYIPQDGNVQGKTVQFRAFIATDLSSHDYCNISWYIPSLESSSAKVYDTDTSTEFQLFSTSKTTVVTSYGFLRVQVVFYRTNAPGDKIQVLYPHLIVDDQIVVLEPEYGYKERDRKIQTEHRARSGSAYVYKWGEYKRRTVPVSYVDSSFKNKVNQWWGDNTDLIIMGSSDTNVNSVRIVNKDLPIGGLIKPYTNLFKGTIELETY